MPCDSDNARGPNSTNEKKKNNNNNSRFKLPPFFLFYIWPQTIKPAPRLTVEFSYLKAQVSEAILTLLHAITDAV